jgi:hypothetical protein
MSDRGSGSLHSTPRVLATIQAAARSLFVSPVLPAPTLAVAFPQHSDEHRPERRVLLATRRHLGTVAERFGQLVDRHTADRIPLVMLRSVPASTKERRRGRRVHRRDR